MFGRSWGRSRSLAATLVGALLAAGCTKALIASDDGGLGSGGAVGGGSGGATAGSGGVNGGTGGAIVVAPGGTGGVMVVASGGAGGAIVVGTGGATPGSGGSTAASGGSTPGSGGSTPGSGGAVTSSGGNGGSFVGTGGGAAGGGLVATTPNVAGQIVVTELMHDADVVSDDFGEWFEVYNPSKTITYDLRGCSIRDINNNKADITSTLLVPPHAFRTLANWTADMEGFTPDYVYSTVKFDNDASDSVSVLCNGVLIDRFLYSSKLASTSGHAFSVDPDHYDAAENDVPGNFCLAVDVYHQVGAIQDFGTPGKTNPPCP